MRHAYLRIPASRGARYAPRREEMHLRGGCGTAAAMGLRASHRPKSVDCCGAEVEMEMQRGLGVGGSRPWLRTLRLRLASQWLAGVASSLALRRRYAGCAGGGLRVLDSQALVQRGLRRRKDAGAR